MSDEISALEYHERTKHTPESVRSGTGLDFDNKPRPYKAYADRPQLHLEGSIPEPSMPALEATASRASERGEPMDRETIASLCYHAAGITKTIRRRGEDIEFRAPSCTGALYHIDLYVVCGPLADLEAGVYHYDPRTNSLEVLREGEYRGVLAAASQDPAVERAPVTMITTSTCWRNAWKYDARTYRHAFWDSGTLLANLLATATALDCPARAVLGFADEPVATLLGIDPEWEAPLELVPIGADDPVPAASRRADIDPIDPAVEPLDSEPRHYPLIHGAWNASTLPDGDRASRWRDRGPRPIDGRGPGDGPVVDLQPVDASVATARPLGETIHRRGSCRAFERDSLSFRKLSTVLDRAMGGVPMDVRDEAAGALQLVDCYCIVNAVDGLEPGAYQYHPDHGVFEQLHAGQYRREAGHLALDQALGADASVCLYFLADLEAVTAALGDRGYRAAQLEAALTAGRLYLTTYAHRDLGGTGLTFYDDEVTDFFAPRAGGQTPMFLYTLGRPA